MTNGHGAAAMASFMTKKKKYKFQVDVRLDELLEVPFVSAVLFAKLRLLDGGNFQDCSSRQEVRDHVVKWDAHYSFPCKMMANASTGILERCVLRVSVRKECKGGRSFTKLGFVDLNLAEFAGAGETSKKALLEGYDTRHRSDNSMLRFSIKMNMLSGDILFKAPSPSLKHKSVPSEDAAVVVLEPSGGGTSDEYNNSSSTAGSIASGSSGFGSLPKKRSALLSSDLVIGHTLAEGGGPTTTTTMTAAANADHFCADASSLPSFTAVAAAASTTSTNNIAAVEHEELSCEQGHSRNSSNTSQMSKASGYSSVHSHSRQSSSGDSGHIRELPKTKRGGPALNIPSTFREDCPTPTPPHSINNKHAILLPLSPPPPDDEVFRTPIGTGNTMPSPSFEEAAVAAAATTTDGHHPNGTTTYYTPSTGSTPFATPLLHMERNSLDGGFVGGGGSSAGDFSRDFCEVLRSKSDFEIPRHVQMQFGRQHEGFLQNFAQRSDNILAYLTPLTRRRRHRQHNNRLHHDQDEHHSTPSNLPAASVISSSSSVSTLKLSPIPKSHSSSNARTTTAASSSSSSLNSLKSTTQGSDMLLLGVQPIARNPSSGSLVLSETGSLDRAKAALERRKKTQPQEQETTAPGRVEGTRVNTDHLIDELIKNTNLEQAADDDSAESSGLQLFIAKDGTAALGSHEVKSQMSAGVFKQVVMEDSNR